MCVLRHFRLAAGAFSFKYISMFPSDIPRDSFLVDDSHNAATYSMMGYQNIGENKEKALKGMKNMKAPDLSFNQVRYKW